VSKKRDYLLVDGYNIIFAWKELRELSEKSLDSARFRLLEILADYQGISQLNIIAVFDAHLVSGGLGSIEQRGGVQVVFTREAETADSYIERSAHLLAGPARARTRVRVATSDILEQVIILGQGATRINALDLEREISEARREVRDRYVYNKPVKRNQLLDLLDGETAEKLERMRFGKEGK